MLLFPALFLPTSTSNYIAQSGFRRKDNTSLQLPRIIQDLCSLKDQRQVSCICFFDLSKAFDTVWHKGLIAKLRAHGVSGSLLAWITSYLMDRNQCVTVNGTLSDPESVTSGVPQGSILGPLLFLTYVIDLPMKFPIFLCLQMIPLSLLPPRLAPPCTPKFRPVSMTLFTVLTTEARLCGVKKRGDVVVQAVVHYSL